MKEALKTSMKRKRSDDDSESIVPKSSETSVDFDIQAQALVVAAHRNIPFNAKRMLHEHSSKRNYILNIQAQNDVQNVVFQETSRELQAEMKKRESKMINIQVSMDLLYQIEQNADKKTQCLNGLETEVANYSSMAAIVKQKYIDIDQLCRQIKSNDLENKASIEREVDHQNRKLVKVNDDIDFVLRQREKTTSQNALISGEKGKLADILSQLQTELEKKRDRTKLIKHEKEANVVTLDGLTNRIERLKNTIENADRCLNIKKEKESLAEQQDSKITLATVIDKNKMMNNELSELKAKTTDYENRCDQIHQANKNIWNKEEQERLRLEYEHKYSSLLNDQKTMAAKVAELQITVDERNSQYNELKRMQSEINKKQQHYAEVESKLTALKTDVHNKLTKNHVVKNSIDNMKAQLRINARNALNLMVTVDSDADSNLPHVSTTVDVEDRSLDNGVESEMTEDCASLAT